MLSAQKTSLDVCGALHYYLDCMDLGIFGFSDFVCLGIFGQRSYGHASIDGLPQLTRANVATDDDNNDDDDNDADDHDSDLLYMHFFSAHALP